MLRMKLFVFPSGEGFCSAFERGRRGEAPAGFGAAAPSRPAQTADSLSVSGGGCRRFGAPATRAALKHVSMVKYAIEHGGDRRHVAQ